MKSVLVGNGINIQFGGKAFSNRFIMMRIVNNARAGKYNQLFDNTLSGGEIVELFNGFLSYANGVLAGEYDDIKDPDLSFAVQDFKSRFQYRVKFEKHHEIPLEDWFLLMELFYAKNPDLLSQRVASKQGLERIVLDAIYNDGRIQNIYSSMSKRVRKYFSGFDNIFTLNYDNNLEMLTRKTVFHLHGDFSVPADSENPITAQGFCRINNGQSVVTPGFSHCYCNALLNYSGELKYKQAEKNRASTRFMEQIRESNALGDYDFSQIELAAEKTAPEAIEWIKAFCDHPELIARTDYHFDDLVALDGELHIIGLSQNNDSHIFRCIDRSNVRKVVFYHHGNAPSKLPICKPVEFVNVKDLWKQLDASTPKYNCNPHIPNTDGVEDIIKALNAISFDEITREEIEQELSRIPSFISDPLCEEALSFMESQKKAGPPKDAEEQMRQFMAISQIALREGILPTCFYILLLNYMNAHKQA